MVETNIPVAIIVTSKDILYSSWPPKMCTVAPNVLFPTR